MENILGENISQKSSLHWTGHDMGMVNEYQEQLYTRK